MNRVIGFTFFLLLLAAIAFISLHNMRPISTSTATTAMTKINWRLISLAGANVSRDAGLLLRLDDNGKLTGNGGCNSFFANYTVHDSSLDIGPIGATRMACPEPQMTLELAFLDALDQATRIESRGKRLVLSTATGEVLAVFATDPADIGP